MRIISLTCLIIFTHLSSVGQVKKFSITLNPFSLMERDGGFTPGIGYNINKRVAVYTDLGLIFLTAGQYTGGIVEYDRSFGYKVKPAVRYYVKDNDIQKGSFIEAEGLYKHVIYDAIDAVNVTDNRGNTVYQYIGGYKVKKDVYGLSFKYGNRLFLTKEKRLGIDLYIGIGARTKNFSVSGVPNGAKPDSFSEFRLFGFFWREGGATSFPAGAKLFYNF